jgi:hypothetical protein
MQAGKRQLHLRLHTGDLYHPALRRALNQILQQRRLTDTRLAAHQRPAFPGGNRLHEPVEHAALSPTVNQLHRASHRSSLFNARCRAKRTHQTLKWQPAIAANSYRPKRGSLLWLAALERVDAHHERRSAAVEISDLGRLGDIGFRGAGGASVSASILTTSSRRGRDGGGVHPTLGAQRAVSPTRGASRRRLKLVNAGDATASPRTPARCVHHRPRLHPHRGTRPHRHETATSAAHAFSQGNRPGRGRLRGAAKSVEAQPEFNE